MFKKILRPKNLIIFFLVVVVVTISYGIIIVEAASVDHYRSNHGTVVNTGNDLDAIGAVCQRIHNDSANNDYFVPAKTLTEWNAFRANYPANVWLANCCDYSFPPGVYVAGAYYKSSECGEYPLCLIHPPGNAGVIIEGSLGGSCGLFKKWRNMRCGALYKPANMICQGDPCITAEVNQIDWNKIKYCTGTYDSNFGKCIYTGSVTMTVDDSGFANLLKTSEYNVNWVGQDTLGTCYSAAPCGDGICSTEYGENCSSCPADCGACPCGDGICGAGEDVYNCPADCYYCGDGICSSPYEDTYTCAYDCGGGYCNDYYDEYNCDADYDCQWDSYDYCCYDLWDSCSSWYGQYDCEMYGCQWDSYNYVCHEYCY